MEVHRGEVYYADLSPVVGSEQGGVRPVLIVQNEYDYFTAVDDCQAEDNAGASHLGTVEDVYKRQHPLSAWFANY